MIKYYVENIRKPKFYRNIFSDWIAKVAHTYGKKIGEINYIFCDDEKILEINRQFLQHDYYTDIITFDYCEGDTLSGDIFISVDTVTANAKEYSVSFDEELKRVMIHGILHLCGQNDKTADEQQEMRIKENNALRMI